MVSNVDSQGSIEGGILIQVLGEISNDGQESRKFAQTFCLAPQESGYYVYNDIFRFLKEDVDSEFGEEQQYESSYNEQHATAADPAESNADKKDTLFSHNVNTSQKTSTATATSGPNATSTQEPPAQTESTPDAHFSGSTSDAVADIEKAAEQPAHAPAELAQEVVDSPTQTPIAAAAQPKEESQVSEAVEAIAAEPAAAAKQPSAAKPVAPMSWAARAAANAKAASPVTTKPAAPKPAAAQTKPAAQNADVERKSQTPANASVADVTRSAFLKNISAKMTDEAIRAALKKFGDFKNVEINRSRSCGFVDYLEPASCAAAIKQNRIAINGETFSVEERRRDVNGKIGPKEKKHENRGDSTRGGRGGAARGGKTGRGGAVPK